MRRKHIPYEGLANHVLRFAQVRNFTGVLMQDGRGYFLRCASGDYFIQQGDELNTRPDLAKLGGDKPNEYYRIVRPRKHGEPDTSQE